MTVPFVRPPRGEVSVHIDAPPDQVWALVSDVTRIGEFSPETFDARWTRGSTGPEVGASFKGHVKRNGVGPTYWSPCQVTACVPNEVFEFAVGSDDMTLNNWGYRLEADGDGTEVTEYFRLEPSLPMRVYWTVLGPLRGRTNERGMRTTLERMKAVLES
ncbi:MAG: SRPBCC family protein [Nocardioides sp.]|nr:SRPBCC family protein [Nocardioides sp.]